MRKLLAITAITFLAGMITAQPKPKPKETAPTAKEMEEMMKEGQKMMDSMGIKMPDMKKMPKMSDQEIQQVWEDADRIVPKKDAAIAAPA